MLLGTAARSLSSLRARSASAASTYQHLLLRATATATTISRGSFSTAAPGTHSDTFPSYIKDNEKEHESTTTTANALSLEIDTRRNLGEGPIWCPYSQELLFIDINRGKIFRWNAERKEMTREVHLRMPLGTVVPHGESEVLAATLKGVCSVNMNSGKIEKYFGDPEKDNPRTRYNDGKCDPRGRFFFGSMGFHCESGLGKLYMLDATRPGKEAEISVVLDNVTISNGICWNADGSVMYYIDTATDSVDALDFDMETGAVSNRRPCIDTSAVTGSPDGCCIDSNGHLWIAMWDGSCVARFDPASGALLETVPLPVSLVTACAFGDGPFSSQLFITTARCGLSEPEPLAGSVFRLDLSSRGVTGAHSMGGSFIKDSRAVLL